MTTDTSPDTKQTLEERKKRYKKSLNLPKSSFGMRANLHQQEPLSLRRWQAMGLYERVLEARSEAPPYIFHDGPPYANGAIHVGHLMNKVLKDLVVRTRLLMGYRCPYVPGWDCHGLPIEHRVMTGLVESGKIAKLDGLDDDARRMAVRRECAAYAAKFKELQSKQMQRLLTTGDYAHPYATMNPAYEQAVLEVFATLIEQDLVYRDLKPVHWSIANETALAEAELEYRDREDPSIYVWFEAADGADVARRFGVEDLDAEDLEGMALMIWTTTPWTLAANLLIAVHEDFEYALVRLNRRLGVLAREQVDAVAKLEGAEAEVLATAKGRDLLGVAYRHPFVDSVPVPTRGDAWRVVAADYVTLEDGTGLVHTAPGHGADDYATGQKEGIPPYCPVQADGTYDATVPEWLRGVSIWTANQTVMEHIRESGHLYHHHLFNHSYPHDWRSKTPVVFRCTEQWFVAVDRPMPRDSKTLRQAALEAASEHIRFVPEWGRRRLSGMLESRPDWCISRQRAWGLPIPAFRVPGGELLLTAASVRAVAQAFARDGSDAWFLKAPSELLADYDPAEDPEAPPGVVIETLEKHYDIFDVWFESGTSWNAVMRQRGLGYPADLYLEGSDQHRGWFQLSLLPALGATGQSPFKTLLTHGFMIDKEGRKMSKSAGNALDVDELLKEFGADVCRWWVSSLAFESDFKVDHEYFELAGESYRKVRNTLRFLLSNLHDFDPEVAILPEAMAPTTLDRWALEQTAIVRRTVLGAYQQFDYRKAHLALFDFCNDTLSAVYLDAVKDRLYCDRPDSHRRRATQSAIYRIASELIRLLAPILAHTADEAWRALLGVDQQDQETTVHRELAGDQDYTADPNWAAVMAAHEDVDRALERAKEEGVDNRLDAGIRLPDPQGVLAPFLAELPDAFSVSRVELVSGDGAVEVVDLRSEPRCERSWKRDGTVKQRSDGGWLSDRDADAVGVA